VGINRPRGRTSERELPAIWVGYGKLAKLFRERARLTQEQLAAEIGYSAEQVASIEQGRRPAKVAFTEAAERVLNAQGVLSTLQDEVDLAKLPAFFQDFASIEAEAISRFSYDPLLVPGLLQTEEYARALFAGHCPPFDDEILERHVEARIGRQRLLGRTPLVELSFVIGESALVNGLGGEAVMRRQLRHLADVGSQRNVEIQVMPATAGWHPGLNGPMVLLETSKHRRVGYVESQEIGSFVSDPAMVTAFGLRYGKLRSQALNIEESARFIQRLAGEQ
jgi:transcriptional regulator with XRE-family HTH domain